MLCVFQDTCMIYFRFINQQKDYTECFAMYSICMIPVILLSQVTRCRMMNLSVSSGHLIFALKPFNNSSADSCGQTALFVSQSVDRPSALVIDDDYLYKNKINCCYRKYFESRLV
jgi:hypothetical protein